MDKSEDESGRHFVEKSSTKNKSTAIELSMKKLSNKIFELDLLRTIVEETVSKLGIREKKVADEIRKLDQLQYERWESRNDFCEKIWKFSNDCDIIGMFNRYLDTPNWITREPIAFDENNYPEICQIKTELEDLNKKLSNAMDVHRSRNEKIMQAEIQLQITKSYKDKDADIIRLKNDVDDYERRCVDLESKISTMELNFDDWPEFKTSPITETKRSFVTASELIAQQDKKKDDVKKSKFSVKKESEISRKFTDKRDSARRS